MKLNKTQITVLAIIAILSVVLYFLPKKVLTNTKEGANRDKPQKEEAAGEAQKPENLKSLDVILTESIAQLSEAEKKVLQLDEKASEDAIKKAIALYKKLDNKLGIAILEEKISNKDLEGINGLNYYEAFKQSEIEENKKAIAAKVIELLKPISDQSTDDGKSNSSKQAINVKCALADCYVNTSANPMSGIMLLREVITTDSTNETALLLLGQFAVKSGQIDKAIGRFKSLVRLYPSNIKYSLYLAQLFEEQGARDKAIETLTSAKKYAVRKTAKDSLENTINHLK